MARRASPRVFLPKTPDAIVSNLKSPVLARRRPQYSADWGDYISFSTHLRARADEMGVDLLLVDTGDRVEGNGLYDSSDPQGKYTYPIFSKQHIDLVCTGNHELYVRETAAREHDQMVPAFSENYIASNLDYVVPETGEHVPMAQRFKRFQTRNQGFDIVAFGFLFDFTDNANNTVVKPVEEAVKEDWFLDAINVRTGPELFVVIGHVGIRMDEFQTIFRAIRKRNWRAPIAFFGGHQHVRDSATFGLGSFALASGRYLETVGWMSIDNIAPGLGAEGVHFNRRYIDHNLFGFHYHTGLNETTFPTPQGKAVSKSIERSREELNLDYRHGCAPKDLWMARAPVDGEDSIYHWLSEEVLPAVIVNEGRKDKPRLIIMNTGAIRFDIFKGPFTRDSSYVVSPFKSKMRYIADVPYTVAEKVLPLLNNAGPIVLSGMNSSFYGDEISDWRIMLPPEQWTRFNRDIFSRKKEAKLEQQQEEEKEGEEEEQEQARLQNARGDANENQKPLVSVEKADGNGDGDGDDDGGSRRLIPGYTTKDDFSSDGDDTIHKPIDFYELPNCIQASVNIPVPSREASGNQEPPEAVDLVFMDFIEPWFLTALQYAGAPELGRRENVKIYMEETFTEAMVGWVERNWGGGEC